MCFFVLKVMKFENILLVAATTLELPAFVNDEMSSSANKTGFHPVVREFQGLQVLITGPGIPATILLLTQILSAKKYDLVINAGIAGSFTESLPLQSVVQVTQDSFPELGEEADQGYQPMYRMKMAKSYKPEFMDADSEMSAYGQTEGMALNALPRVKGITVNTISGKKERIAWFRDMRKAEVESMEGAGVFCCCQHFQVPCIQIRSVSNFIHPDHLDKWDIRGAVETLQIQLKKIIHELS